MCPAVSLEFCHASGPWVLQRSNYHGPRNLQCPETHPKLKPTPTTACCAGVTTLMVRDFALMQRCAWVLANLPLVGNPQLKDSLMQFGAPLKEQLDLKVEADNLNRCALSR